tara:strand:- start:17462 stop:18889 length:1428 start_codon:yes stop_codon:yes gene_type:complete
MLFNSIEYLFFLISFLSIYWLLSKKLGYQNLFILFSSYIFYGWWDYRFLALILLSSLVDFTIGNLLYRSNDLVIRKFYLSLSLVFNLGILGFFKYYNFFIEEFSAFASIFNFHFSPNYLNIILPVGISFYTFQTLGYSIDIFKGNIKPTNNIISFLTYVSFFPQLVAGPIERASNLLPQIDSKRNFNKLTFNEGLRQITWGLFKKVVIADNCAVYVDFVFADSASFSSLSLLIGMIFFAIQIYCDFSGYSDIAIGTAKLMGIKLMTNFNYPYFSKNIGEFWRRWHISLSTWFRDYLYIPIGGSRGNMYSKIRNILIIFLVSGFWHGANWTFIFWGLLNALFSLPYILTKNKNKNNHYHQNNLIFKFKEIGLIIFTFFQTCLAWVYFRSSTIGEANSYILNLFTLKNTGNTIDVPFYLSIIIILFFLVEYFGKNNVFPLEKIRYPIYIRYLIYCILIFMILIFSTESDRSFIYFQF